MVSSSITSSGFTVSWGGGDGATSYTYTIDGVATTPSADNGLTSKSATFEGLTAETTYNIVVSPSINEYTSDSDPFIVTTISEP